MLRLDPGEGRIKNARSFQVWEGGGEYNVTRGLSKCFEMDTAIVTSLAKNEIGKLIESFIKQGSVDTSFIKWIPYDGIGQSARNGLNFTERGFGIRGALGVSDRANTAASLLKAGDIDWESIFGTLGSRWFHTGGIFAALSKSTPSVVIEAVKAAKKHGTIVSYDLNFRPSLWNHFGGAATAQKVNREIAPYVDVMIGNEEDFTACLGMTVQGNDDSYTNIDIKRYKKMIDNTIRSFPNIKVAATTLREVKTATVNSWCAIGLINGSYYTGKSYENLEILDRIGGGDSFASGLIYGLMSFNDPQKAIDYGTVHGALAMTTPGDTSMADKKEIEAIVSGAGARVIR